LLRCACNDTTQVTTWVVIQYSIFNIQSVLYPILFQISGFTLYTQTVCLLIAFISGLFIAVREGKRFAITRLDITDIVLWGFISAIFGARLLFMLIHWESSSFTVSEICTLGTEDGGFSLHGGLLVGGFAGFLVAQHHHVRIWRLADAFAPGLAVAMFFMRLGCLLNGCDYGVVTTVPWGIPLHDAIRHPIQLYEGIGNLFLFPLLIFFNKKPARPGYTFLLYMLLSAIIRFGVDFYREEYVYIRIWNLFTIPQLLAIGIAIFAIFGLYQKILINKKKLDNTFD
jgi:phosphatidylglycerol:prolipoprotein diacylglycerol transferase